MPTTITDDRAAALKLRLGRIEDRLLDLDGDLRQVALMTLPSRRPAGLSLDQISARRCAIEREIGSLSTQQAALRSELGQC